MRYSFIVAAAGIGKRMGFDYPKQFFEYQGRPLFLKSVEKIYNNNKVEKIVVVTNKELIRVVEEEISKYGFSDKCIVTEGGKERQDSIYNGLKLIENSNDMIVGIHDGVRPFIKDEYIDNAFKILSDRNDIDGVVTAIKVKDTIKIVKDNGVIEYTPVRDTLMAAQTPQVFRMNVIIKSYENAYRDNFYGTDDSSLLERYGKNVVVCEGGYDNIKITTPEDLKYLED